MTGPAPCGLNLRERILLRVEVDHESGCWLWTGAVDKGTGYARLTYDNQSLSVHRASYASFVGDIPEGLQLDHLCRVRHCVNPDHLEPVTGRENTRRSPLHNAARVACPHGHVYDDANTIFYRGRRYCRACRDLRNSRRDRSKATAQPYADTA